MMLSAPAPRIAQAEASLNLLNGTALAARAEDDDRSVDAVRTDVLLDLIENAADALADNLADTTEPVDAPRPGHRHHPTLHRPWAVAGARSVGRLRAHPGRDGPRGRAVRHLAVCGDRGPRRRRPQHPARPGPLDVHPRLHAYPDRLAVRHRDDGPTCECNTWALCRRHHRLKHQTPLRVSSHDPNREPAPGLPHAPMPVPGKGIVTPATDEPPF